MFDDSERFDQLATPMESVYEWAANVGHTKPDQAWLLHDFDCWVWNPFYSGPPVPHPEDYDPEDYIVHTCPPPSDLYGQGEDLYGQDDLKEDIPF